jgi:hypothetical protein
MRILFFFFISSPSRALFNSLFLSFFPFLFAEEPQRRIGLLKVCARIYTHDKVTYIYRLFNLENTRVRVQLLEIDIRGPRSRVCISYEESVLPLITVSVWRKISSIVGRILNPTEYHELSSQLHYLYRWLLV